VEVNIHEAKTHLSRLIQKALAGEEVTIAKAGKPLVRLTPIERPKPILGSARGTITLLPGWDDDMTEEELKEWEDGPVFPPFPPLDGPDKPE
jgi:prevent-host-death family protein